MQITMSIGAVERDTGLSKDALRAWERRYGFPTPIRDGMGERAYLLDQVNKLRVLKRLTDQGHRPGKIIYYGLQELQQLLQQLASQASDPSGSTHVDPSILQAYLGLCKTHQTSDLRHRLSQALSRMGLERFIVELLSPLNRLVGESWANGTLQIFEEHLYTEAVQIVMRSAISTLQVSRGEIVSGPRILMTTLPQEQHGLGLLMAEAIFTQEGANCISLGVQTPVADIVEAAKAHSADIVALSVSGAMNSRQMREGLTNLRSKLPASTEIWVGGDCLALIRRPPEFVHILANLSDIHLSLSRWQNTHGA